MREISCCVLTRSKAKGLENTPIENNREGNTHLDVPQRLSDISSNHLSGESNPENVENVNNVENVENNTTGVLCKNSTHDVYTENVANNSNNVCGEIQTVHRMYSMKMYLNMKYSMI